MGLKTVSFKRIEKITEEDIEKEHNSWLSQRIYSKTPLSAFQYCRERYRQRYILKTDETWGPDLVEGLAGHKVLEVGHVKLLENSNLYPDEMREVFKAAIKKIEHRLDGSFPDVDESWARIGALCKLYFVSWQKWYRTVTGIEETWGIDKEVTMGGARVAGHDDLREKRKLVVDFKFVNSQSGHRYPKLLDMGMELYKEGLGVERTAILPLVKNLKRKPMQKTIDKKPGMVIGERPGGVAVIDGLQEVRHTAGTKEAVEQVVCDLVAAIEAGNLDGGPPEIGAQLCQPAYCNFFGRCRYTKALNPKDYMKKKG